MPAPLPADAEMMIDCRCELGEGPVWHEGAFWWVDIQPGQLHRWTPTAGETTTWELKAHVGEVGAAIPASDGRFILCTRKGLAWLDVRQGESAIPQLISHPEADVPGNRFNDAKASPQGRLFAGTMATDGRKQAGALYRIDPDLAVTRIVEGVGVSNGLAWTADGRTLYYIDTATRRVDAFDHDPATGALANRQPAIEGFAEGHPDGMTIDEQDRLWVCLWGGQGVACCDGQSGEILRHYPVPAKNVTSCCFGGDNLDELWITTHGGKADEAHRREFPHAGCVFRLRTGVRGRPVDVFRLA